jgi:hypothetical protein
MSLPLRRLADVAPALTRLLSSATQRPAS